MSAKGINLGRSIKELKTRGRCADIGKKFPTGIEELDKKLNGGFSVGITGLVAAPSQGKSALAHQIAENIANTGCPVLLFSTEMTSRRIEVNSVSRHSYIYCPEKALTSAEVIEKNNLGNLTPEFSSAVDESAIACKNITLFGCNDWDHGLQDIVNTVKKFNHKHKDLFVIVDYLQELHQIGNDRKAFIDYAMSTLKELSEKLQIPILVVCAINRDDRYVGKVSLDILKDSGRLEYYFDLIIAIDQVQRISARERSVCLDILKQKDGEAGVSVRCRYHAAYYYFEAENVSEKSRDSMSAEQAADRTDGPEPFDEMFLCL